MDTQLRIIQANGGLVNGTVPIDCVIKVDLTPEGEAANGSGQPPAAASTACNRIGL
jgi:hypothetical protein